MINFNLKATSYYIGCILVFVAISVGYFLPELIEGKVLFQADTQQGIAIGHEAKIFKETTGETTRWTNSLFGGMPTYQSSPSYASRDVVRVVEKVYRLFLPQPASYLFIMMLGFFIFMLVLKVRTDLALLGAIMYAFSSYFFILIEAGHLWKYITLAYIPPTIGGILLTYRGKYLAGGAMTAFFAALQIYSNHVQMTYYFLFVIAAIVVGILIESHREKQLAIFVKATGTLVIAALLAIGVNLSNLYHTYQYSKETMRGGTELSKGPGMGASTKNGLEKEYITQWSYGIGETLTLLIPNANGGATGALGQNPDAIKVAKPQFAPYFNQFNSYWGNQPFTSGPVYVGALVVFLFVFSLFIVTGWLKWSLLAVTILSILLSWGKNFMFLTDLFIDYFPLYNKFRAVSSMLVIAEFCIPILAVLGISEIIKTPDVIKRNMRNFFISLGLTAGLCALIALFPSIFFNFLSDQEAQTYLVQAAQQPDFAKLLENLMEGRASILQHDAWRSCGIILLGAGLIYCYMKGLMKAGMLILLLSVVTIGDMWAIDKRYLNASKFVDARQMNQPFRPTAADLEILADKDPNFRVLNLSTNTFNDAITSYFHKSVGGYHAAKLQRYQDLIDYYLIKDIDPNIINMLNTKYVIVSDEHNQPKAEMNPEALGNAWFVDHIEWVNNANEELDALAYFNPASTAIIDKRFDKAVNQFKPNDSIASIKLSSYTPNRLVYEAVSETDGLVLFSEIYYPGWKATINGKEAPIVRANYVLRALSVPAGINSVEFIFEPKSIQITDILSIISMILIGLLGAGALIWSSKK